MSQHSKALVILGLGVAIAVSGLALTRQVIAVAGDAGAERLNRAILEFVAQKNPQAPISAFLGFSEVVLGEAERTNIDHCLILAQAEVESEFKHDALGSAGEVGLFQMLPSTAALFEPALGPFRRPVLNKERRDLGDLADPAVSTRFAMAYLRDIMSRRSSLRDVLTEYNGGPSGRHPHYYRMVTGAYVEVLAHPELKCRLRDTPRETPLLTLLSGA